jgi:hypothetical protein
MVSLLELAKVVLARVSATARDHKVPSQVEEEGVTFRSPTDGSMMLLTPEKRCTLPPLEPFPNTTHALPQHRNAKRNWRGRHHGA